MRKKEIIKNQRAMAAFAARIAKKIVSVSPRAVRVSPRSATIVALKGDLGAGKTTFVQGFLKSLGVKERVVSPTFLIIRSHPLLMVKGQWSKVFHIDCYRIDSARELISLGFKKIIADPKNIVLIEWADKIKKLLPRDTRWIEFRHGGKATERIILY